MGNEPGGRSGGFGGGAFGDPMATPRRNEYRGTPGFMTGGPIRSDDGLGSTPGFVTGRPQPDPSPTNTGFGGPAGFMGSNIGSQNLIMGGLRPGWRSTQPLPFSRPPDPRLSGTQPLPFGPPITSGLP